MALSKGGGYSCEFVEEPPNELQTECAVCLQVLCEPSMVSCCGEKFCQYCIKQVANENKACPHCNSSKFTSMKDKKLERELYALYVYCSNKDKGCEWIGPLKDLGQHCNASKSTDHWTASANNNFDDCGCRYEEVVCTKCKKQIPRSHFNAHLSKGCATPEGECQFHYAGCNASVSSKDMKRHLEENVAFHLSLIVDLTRNLSNENARMNEYLATLSNGLENEARTEMKPKKSKKPTSAPRQCCSLVLWIGGTLVVLFLSIFVATNNPQLTDYVKHLISKRAAQDINLSDFWDHLETKVDALSISLNELSKKVEDLTKKQDEHLLGQTPDDLAVLQNEIDSLKQGVSNIETLEQLVASHTSKLQTMMNDLKNLQKVTEGMTIQKDVDNIKRDLSGIVEVKLSALSNSLAEIGKKIESLAKTEETQILRQRMDSFQREIDSLKGEVRNLPRPLSREEIAALVITELEARRPPHHRKHGHRGGCRGHH